MTLRIGDRVDDLTFLQPDGSAVTLAAFAGRPLLLVFLRHLA
jgi:peroxiredoxin